MMSEQALMPDFHLFQASPSVALATVAAKRGPERVDLAGLLEI